MQLHKIAGNTGLAKNNCPRKNYSYTYAGRANKGSYEKIGANLTLMGTMHAKEV